MKSSIACLAVAFSVLCVSLSQAADYTPPTDAQIEQLLADPLGLPELVKGATIQQIADVVTRAIEKLNSSTATADQKKQVVAVLTAEAVALAGKEAPQLMELLLGAVGPDLLPTMAAAAAVAAADLAGAVTDAMVAKLGPDTPGAKAVRDAAANPETTLGSRLYLLLLRIVMPSELLVEKRLPGGAANLPLPPIRRPVQDYEGQ